MKNLGLFYEQTNKMKMIVWTEIIIKTIIKWFGETDVLKKENKKSYLFLWLKSDKEFNTICHSNISCQIEMIVSPIIMINKDKLKLFSKLYQNVFILVSKILFY